MATAATPPLPTAQRPSDDDAAKVGLSFIDVLFALIVGKIFDDIGAHARDLGADGAMQLALAFVVTVTSWVGYHESKRRARYPLRFFTAPLWQFVVDVSLVAAYGALVLGARGTSSLSVDSFRWDATIVALIFIGYFVWDRLSLAMSKTGMYSQTKDRPKRRRVTVIFLWVTVVIAVVTWPLDAKGRWLVAGNAVLSALAVTYRWAKDAAG